jgi:hypothetical protein
MRGPLVKVGGLYLLDVPVFSRFGLRLIRDRVSNRLFCWTADHAPRVAEWWAFRR